MDVINILLLKKNNLFDSTSAPTMNWYLNDTEIGTSDVDYSTYLEIKPNTTYEVSKMIGQRFRIGTTSEEPTIGNNLLQTITSDNSSSIIIKTNSNVKYLVIYFMDTSIEETDIEEMKKSIVVKEV